MLCYRFCLQSLLMFKHVFMVKNVYASFSLDLGFGSTHPLPLYTTATKQGR